MILVHHGRRMPRQEAVVLEPVDVIMGVVDALLDEEHSRLFSGVQRSVVAVESRVRRPRRVLARSVRRRRLHLLDPAGFQGRDVTPP